MKKTLPILWLTGNTGAGKTTLARGIERHCNSLLPNHHPLARRVIVLDGDDMRASISKDLQFSPEERNANNLRIATLARVFQARGFLVVVAVIAPFAWIRKDVDTLCNPIWIYVSRHAPDRTDAPYEIPASPSFHIDNAVLTKVEALTMLLDSTEALTGIAATVEVNV